MVVIKMFVSPGEKIVSSRWKVITVSTLAVFLFCQATTYAGNPWASAVGEAIGLRDVTKDMRNRAERLFSRSPISYLARLQNEYACALFEAIQCGAPRCEIESGVSAFQQVQFQLNQLINQNRFASNDHGLRTYRRLVEDRFRDLVRDLERCNSSHDWNQNDWNQGGWSGGIPRDSFDDFGNAPLTEVPQPIYRRMRPVNAGPRNLGGLPLDLGPVFNAIPGGILGNASNQYDQAAELEEPIVPPQPGPRNAARRPISFGPAISIGPVEF